MENCPIHGQPFKYVKPGVSKKTWKAYQGFWSCPEMGCREKPTEFRPAPDPMEKQITAELQTIKEDEKWTNIGQQKNRSNIAASIVPAYVTAGKPIDWVLMRDVEMWVLTGQTPKGSNVFPTGFKPKVGRNVPDQSATEINVDDIPF